MSVPGGLLAHGLRYVFDVAADRLVQVVDQHLTDHGDALPKALTRAHERAWQVVGLALAGDGLFRWVGDLFRSADMRRVRDDIQAFLNATPTGLSDTAAGVRAKAAEEWNRLRKAGRLAGGTIPVPQLARQAATLERYSDTARMADSARQVVAGIAADFRTDAPHLADLLTFSPPGGTPLLVSAFAFFFRRELETQPELFRGLTFDYLRRISDAQERGLALLDVRTAGVLDQIDVLFDALDKWFIVADGKLDDIRNKLDQFIDKFDISTRVTDPLKVSVTNERERAQLRAWRDEFRKLPPELVDSADWTKLGDALAAGRLLAEAREALGRAAADAPKAAATEAESKAYRAACEQEAWADALASLTRAADLDPARFNPFPLNRYEPLAILGAGGFGTMIRCRQKLAKGRDVAVKTFHAADLGRDVNDVFAEAHTLSEIAAPGVVKVIHWHYADPAEARPFLVMEYFPGTSLATHLKEHGRLSVADLLPIASHVTTAMTSAHTANILHRDLKPGNILVRRTETGWDVRVIDFGLAIRLAAAQASMSTTHPHRTRRDQSFVGSLEYASPEQKGTIRAEVGPRSDLYGFGKTMLESLLGTTEPVSEDWDGVPADVREPLKRALEKCVIHDPGRRYAGFGELTAALTAVIGGRPPEPTPPVEERRPPPPLPVNRADPGPDAPTADGPVVPLYVNDMSNITRNLDGRSLNPWLTEEICRSSVLSIECIDLPGKPTFRFVPFDAGQPYGMKPAPGANEASWDEVTAGVSKANPKSLRVQFRREPISVSPSVAEGKGVVLPRHRPAPTAPQERKAIHSASLGRAGLSRPRGTSSTRAQNAGASSGR